MNDEYAVLVRVTRRPMQRWWRQVGMWWLVGLTLIYALKVVAYSWVRNAGPSGIMPPGSESGMLGAQLLALFLPEVIWLLAAAKLNAVWQDLISPAPASQMASVRFRVMMLQGVPILVVISVCNLAVRLAAWQAAPHYFSTNSFFRGDLQTDARVVASTVITMAWLLGLVITSRNGMRLAWWFVATCLATGFATIIIYLLAPSALEAIQPRLTGDSLLSWVTSCCFLALMLYCFNSSRERVGLRLYYAVLSAQAYFLVAIIWSIVKPESTAIRYLVMVGLSLTAGIRSPQLGSFHPGLLLQSHFAKSSSLLWYLGIPVDALYIIVSISSSVLAVILLIDWLLRVGDRPMIPPQLDEAHSTAT